MAITLRTEEYDEIRLLLSKDIDDSDLTDTQIDGNTVLGNAERYVLTIIPSGMTGLNTAESNAYRSAVLYRCAIILAPNFPDQIAERVGDVQERYQGTPVADKIAFLQDELDQALQPLIDAGHGIGIDPQFEIIQVSA